MTATPAELLEQPYAYRRHELVEPDWRRLPGFAEVTAECALLSESAFWRSHDFTAETSAWWFG